VPALRMITIRQLALPSMSWLISFVASLPMETCLSDFELEIILEKGEKLPHSSWAEQWKTLDALLAEPKFALLARVRIAFWSTVAGPLPNATDLMALIPRTSMKCTTVLVERLE
jgi:hypothetical protein